MGSQESQALLVCPTPGSLYELLYDSFLLVVFAPLSLSSLWYLSGQGICTAA